MAVRIYRSSDVSAPVLNGTVGSLATVLDAVLVTGYGAQTAAGWTTAYTATNQRMYRNDPVTGTGYYLFLNDTGAGAHGGREARVCGFKTATGMGVGTEQFPLSSQSTIGIGQLVARKSNVADTTAKVWTIVADQRTFYMFVETNDLTVMGGTNTGSSYAWMFGDFGSYSSTDVDNCIIIARKVEANEYLTTMFTTEGWDGDNIVDAFNALAAPSNTMFASVMSGHFVASSYTGTGGSIRVGKHSDIFKMGYPTNTSLSNTPQMGYQGAGRANSSITTWVTAFLYPNGPDSGLYTTPVWLHHNGFIRGYLRGIWNPLQHLPLANFDTYSGTGNLAGKSFIAINLYGSGAWTNSSNFTNSQVHVEISDTWE